MNDAQTIIDGLPAGHSAKVAMCVADIESNNPGRVRQGQTNASALAASLGSMAEHAVSTPAERAAYKRASALLTGMVGASRMLDVGARDAALTTDRSVPIDTDPARNAMIARMQRAHVR